MKVARYVDHVRGDAQIAFRRSNEKWAKGVVRGARGVDLLLMARYRRDEKRRGPAVANERLRQSVERLKTPGVGRSAAMSGAEVDSLAAARAGFAVQLCGRAGDDLFAIAAVARKFCESCGMVWPQKKITLADDESDRVRKIHAAVLRVQDEKWWCREIRRCNRRQVEREMIGLGEVGYGKPYISNWGKAVMDGEKKRQADMLKEIEAERVADGCKMTLADLSATTVANERVRFCEITVRVKGLQEWIEGQGLAAIFVTITAPSRFHARPKSYNHEINPLWVEAGRPSPRDGARYLAQVWARVRARAKKQHIDMCGLRIAEPHSDGCPHYHLVLGVQPGDIEVIKNIILELALQDGGDEPGAKKYRVKFEDLDPARGDVLGYVMKYLAKGIHGEGLGDAIETGGEEDGLKTGVDGQECASRVVAWARMWGIRQFQFFGCGSIGVWRGLRRVRDVDVMEARDEIRECRFMADQARFGEFLSLVLGGVDLGLVRLWRESQRYGDLYSVDVGLCIKGVPSSIVVTKRDQWRLLPRDANRERSPVDFLGRCAGALALSGWDLPDGWGSWMSDGDGDGDGDGEGWDADAFPF